MTNYDTPPTQPARGEIREDLSNTRNRWRTRIKNVSPEERDRRVVADPMQRILEHVGQYTQLSDRTTRELIRRYQEKGDLEAKEILVMHNIAYVIHFAKPLYKRVKTLQGTASLSFEDLVQEGTFGLTRAIEKYNLEHESDAQFSTYAPYHIKHAVRRLITDHVSTIRLPLHVREELDKYEKALRSAMQAAQAQPTDEQLVQAHADYEYPPLPPELRASSTDEEGWTTGEFPEFRVTQAQITYDRNRKMVVSGLRRASFLRQLSQPRSLDRMLEAEERHAGVLSTDSEDPTHDEVALEMTNTALTDLLKRTLTAHELKIIELRYGLGGKLPRTIDEVGRQFNVTRERIRQIEAFIFRKLRGAQGSGALVEPYDFDPVRLQAEREAYTERTGQDS